MSAEYFYGVGRQQTRKTGKASPPGDPRGKSATGRIARILVGQGYGYIRLRDGRDVYFHRCDSREGTPFGDLRVDDVVTFELIEDSVSGARALKVMQQKKSRLAAKN
jgi:cold shock CspA family protein